MYKLPFVPFALCSGSVLASSEYPSEILHSSSVFTFNIIYKMWNSTFMYSQPVSLLLLPPYFFPFFHCLPLKLKLKTPNRMYVGVCKKLSTTWQKKRRINKYVNNIYYSDFSHGSSAPSVLLLGVVPFCFRMFFCAPFTKYGILVY